MGATRAKTGLAEAEKISRDSAIPLYYQLESRLRKWILSGEIPPEHPLPGEETLAVQYGVSRITVRQALRLLENDGLIVRIRGKGTFVSPQPPRVESTRFAGFIEDLIALGVHSEVKLLSMEMINPPDHLRERFQLEVNDRLLKIEKIRLVEGEPFSYVINYLPSEIGERIRAVDLAEKPLLEILEEKLGLLPVEAEQTIEAASADAHVAGHLDVPIGDPLLKVERSVFDPSGRPLEHVSVLYRADKYFFTVRLKRSKPRQPWVKAGRD